MRTQDQHFYIPTNRLNSFCILNKSLDTLLPKATYQLFMASISVAFLRGRGVAIGAIFGWIPVGVVYVATSASGLCASSNQTPGCPVAALVKNTIVNAHIGVCYQLVSNLGTKPE